MSWQKDHNRTKEENLLAEIIRLLEKLNINLTSNAAVTGGALLPVYVRTVPISSAEILAIDSSPKELIPAPGVGKTIIPIGGIFEYTYGTTAYAGAGAARWEIRASSGTSALGAFFYKNANAWSMTDDMVASLTDFHVAAAGTDMSGVIGAVENDPIVITGIGSGDPISGDGTASVTLLYIVKEA